MDIDYGDRYWWCWLLADMVTIWWRLTATMIASGGDIDGGAMVKTSGNEGNMNKKVIWIRNKVIWDVFGCFT